MRPLHLRFAGIGPYPGAVDVDFRTLNAKGLYLIVGPTGAGKTTILDAMTYALYGKVPSDREGSLSSLHLDSNKPFVEFEFAHRDRSYKIRREPGLPNKQAQTNKQSIRIFDASGTEIDTKVGTTQVNSECQAITGLTADEFAQVILLPQGKFQKFLMAKGSEKRAVLQTIFGTRVYNRVVERLKTSAAALEETLEKTRILFDNKTAIIESNVDSVESIATIDISPELQQDTASLVEYLSKCHTELADQAKDSKAIFAQLKSDLRTAEKEAERFDKSQLLTDLRKIHTAEQRQIDKARKQLAEHAEGRPIYDAITEREELKLRAKDSVSEVAKIRTEIGRAVKMFKVLPKVTMGFSDAVSTATPSELSQEHAKLVGVLESAASEYDELVNLAELIDDNAAEVTATANQLSDLNDRLNIARSQEKKSKKRLADARTLVKGLSKAQTAANDLEDLLVKADVAGATSEVSLATKRLGIAQSKYDKCESVLRAAQAQRTKELAGVLADALAEGEPCPVCGSTGHPKKAKHSASTAVDVEAAEAERDEATRQRANAERDLKDAQSKLEDAKGHAAKLPSTTEQKQIKKTAATLEKVNDSIPDLEDDVGASGETIASLLEEISELKRMTTRLSTEGENFATRKAKLAESVSTIGSSSSVNAALKVCNEIEEHIDALDSAVKAADIVEGQERQATTTAKNALTQSTFKNEKAVFAALLEEGEVQELDAFVATFEERQKSIDKLDASVGTDPVPPTRPDLDEITKQANLADASSQEASDTANTVKNALAQIRSAHKEIRVIGPQIKRQENEATKARAIATVFEKGAGVNSGQLSLEVWVQRTLFEEVCLVANTQLRTLSNYRYSLTLEQEEGGVSKRNASGLDIYVLDSHSGTTRPVHTLSGGEQFLASLALALSLAEVVQQHAGGIELPCLFIDEGFGGLDLEALDLAINVLSGLHAAGRTVGIITHVETMQEQLPIGIRVQKSDHGSTLEVLA